MWLPARRPAHGRPPARCHRGAARPHRAAAPPVLKRREVEAARGPWQGLPMLALRRFVPYAAAVALAITLHSPAARAQGTPGPPLPVGMDVRKAAVGSWSSYDVAVKGMPPMRQRFALVARDAATTTLELTTDGGPVPGTVVVRVVL